MKTFHKLSYGLYVICSTNGKNINGQIANVVSQITADPITIVTSINKQNLTHEYIEKSKQFSVSILNENTPMPFIGTFGFKSGRDINKFDHVQYKKTPNNIPIVTENSIGYLVAKVKQEIDEGTHTVFLADVTEAEVLSDEPPMTYAYYHECKGGVSPKTAPTYTKEIDIKQQKEEKTMDKYVCTVCGYVYDPEKGDPDNGIQPGTAFEDLPEDWTCPLCGAKKEDFEKE